MDRDCDRGCCDRGCYDRDAGPDFGALPIYDDSAPSGNTQLDEWGHYRRNTGEPHPFLMMVPLGSFAFANYRVSLGESPLTNYAAMALLEIGKIGAYYYIAQKFFL